MATGFWRGGGAYRIWGLAGWGVAGALLVVTPASAQEAAEPDGDAAIAVEIPRDDRMSEPLVTDRPDFTESTETIPPGHVQLELGYTFTVDRESDVRVRDHTAPELLLRIGVHDRVELRLGWEGYAWFDAEFEDRTPGGRRVTRDDHEEGANDLSIGFKVKLAEQNGWVPHLGILGGITVPSGSAELTSGDVDPSLVLAWAYDLTDRFGIAGNLGVGAPTEEGDRFFQATGSIAAAISITDRVGTYVEYFGIYPNAEHADCAHTVNGGVTYLINNDLQLDWRIGVGLNEEADDFFTGVGLSWRF